MGRFRRDNSTVTGGHYGGENTGITGGTFHGPIHIGGKSAEQREADRRLGESQADRVIAALKDAKKKK
ncbi:hypothetical protein ACF058_27515 [Streptomyces sp. NPDC015501]|uniref:hypothetical protein n=1 Tax=unclassified Streptomyces TaxID=2593676 RepID=UPI0011A43A25|nr:hypothetical protein A3L22_28855 [Streptomyces griseus subsp. griseus]